MTDPKSFPLPGWTRDWSKPNRTGKHANAHFELEDRGHPTPCWTWRGSCNRFGYARILRSGGHRLLYEQTLGPVPDGLVLDHLCKHRNCVNPWHLEPVTQAENVRRGTAGSNNARKTHCPQGHAYAGDNLRVTSQGRRICVTCRTAAKARFDARKRRATGLQ